MSLNLGVSSKAVCGSGGYPALLWWPAAHSHPGFSSLFTLVPDVRHFSQPAESIADSESLRNPLRLRCPQFDSHSRVRRHRSGTGVLALLNKPLSSVFFNRTAKDPGQGKLANRITALQVSGSMGQRGLDGELNHGNNAG